MSKVFQLFFSFFKIGLFSFGGGYVIIPMIEKEIIYKHHWIDSATFVNIIGIAAVTPGPISLNSATFVGNKMFGVFGGLVSTTGVVLPSFIITLFVSKFYFRKKDQLIQKTIFYRKDSGKTVKAVIVKGSPELLEVFKKNFPREFIENIR